MARVKGSYIAKVIIDFDYEEDDFDFKPFEELDKGTMQNLFSHFTLKQTGCFGVSAIEMY